VGRGRKGEGSRETERERETESDSHKRQHTVQFHLYRIFRLCKSIMTESRLAIASG
jgi:hypothetical protein